MAGVKILLEGIGKRFFLADICLSGIKMVKLPFTLYNDLKEIQIQLNIILIGFPCIYLICNYIVNGVHIAISLSASFL